MLIGREEKLERIERALEAARSGGSGVLLLCGEPGIGKTALLLVAIERAEGMTVLRTRGLEAEVELPFAGVAELCEPALALRERLPPAQAAALAGALQLEQAAPQARLAIGAALLGLLSLAAEAQPVLCVVDNLQWLDEPSLEALRCAARRLGAEGVVVLLASGRSRASRSRGSRRWRSGRCRPTGRSSSSRPAAIIPFPSRSPAGWSPRPAATRSRCSRSPPCARATSWRPRPGRGAPARLDARALPRAAAREPARGHPARAPGGRRGRGAPRRRRPRCALRRRPRRDRPRGRRELGHCHARAR